jgi:hypothetical protein
METRETPTEKTTYCKNFIDKRVTLAMLGTPEQGAKEQTT